MKNTVCKECFDINCKDVWDDHHTGVWHCFSHKKCPYTKDLQKQRRKNQKDVREQEQEERHERLSKRIDIVELEKRVSRLEKATAPGTYHNLRFKGKI